MPETRKDASFVQVRVDSRGRITIPPETRDELNIKNGSFLYLVRNDDGTWLLNSLRQLVGNLTKRPEK